MTLGSPEALQALKRKRLRVDECIANSIIHILEHGATVADRAGAAYALLEVPSPSAITALERTVANKHEDPKVRGYAAEALAHHHRQESHRVLLSNLHDRCKEVRFWCAFALGEMAEVDTMELLESLPRVNEKKPAGALRSGQANLWAVNSIQQKLDHACQFCVAS